MPYTVEIARSAQRVLAKLIPSVRERVVAKIRGLREEPRPVGAKKLRGSERWRVRVGQHRVIYSIDDGRLLVAVVKIGDRRDVYR